MHVERSMRSEVALSAKKPPLSKLVTLVFPIAALHIVLAVVPLIPYGPSAAVLLKPSEGILLGSLGGALAAFIAGVVSSVIWPSNAVLGLATWVPGVVGAIGAGMLMKRRWKPVAATMLVILLGFLAHPLGPPVLLYSNWDKTIALVLVYPVSSFLRQPLGEAWPDSLLG